MSDVEGRSGETAGLVSGGYFLVRPSAAPRWTPEELVSSPVLSLSDCICPSISALWASPWVERPEEERLREASAFGVGPDTLAAVLHWFDHSMETAMGWPNVFRSVWGARCFAERFVPGESGVLLVGLALRVDDGARLLHEAAPGDDGAPGGVLEMIAAGLPPEPGGEVLGWEVLGFDGGGFHSWFCNRLEVEVDGELGIRPGKLGLIASENDATAVAAYADGDPGVEHGVWLGWELLGYPRAIPGARAGAGGVAGSPGRPPA